MCLLKSIRKPRNNIPIPATSLLYLRFRFEYKKCAGRERIRVPPVLVAPGAVLSNPVASTSQKTKTWHAIGC